MTKIVHLTSVHPIQDVRIFFKECLSLKEAGYDVALIAQATQDQIIDGIHIYAVGKTSSRFKRMSLLLFKIYRKALSINADIYHFHDPELIPIGVLLRFHGKKVIYDVHEDLPRDILLKDWIPNIVRHPLSKMLAMIEFFSAKIFNGVVTVTPHINTRFSHVNAIEVRNYPALKEFVTTPGTQQKNVLCYAGLINHNRGLQEMLQAATMTDTRLYLAGRVQNEALQQEINACTKTKYLGYLDRNQLSVVYNEALAGLALLHPSLTFNVALPIKLFEYMAAGIPVVASNFALWRDIIETHDCGFCVDPLNIKMICEKINYLKENPQVALEMGERGRRAVATFYNWQTESQKLISLYEQILQ